MEIQHESSKFAKEVKNCGSQNFPFIIAAYIPNEMPLPVPLCKSFTLSKINMKDFAKKSGFIFKMKIHVCASLAAQVSCSFIPVYPQNQNDKSTNFRQQKLNNTTLSIFKISSIAGWHFCQCVHSVDNIFLAAGNLQPASTMSQRKHKFLRGNKNQNPEKYFGKEKKVRIQTNIFAEIKIKIETNVLLKTKMECFDVMNS